MTKLTALYAGNKYIDEHKQSYLLSFKKSVEISEVFPKFWKSAEACKDVHNVIANTETKITNHVGNAPYRDASVLNTDSIEVN